MKSKNMYIAWFIAICTALLISWLALQDIENHAAWSYTDDMSIAYAHIYKYPERFEDDIYSVKSLGSRNGSIVNWGSAFLWKNFDIAPLITYEWIAYAQSLTLGLSIFFITWQITTHFQISLLAMLITFAIRPYTWNLGSYNDLYPYVYAAQLSLNFVLLGLGFVLANRRQYVLIILILAGLIHPMMGAYGFTIVGLYWGTTTFLERDWHSLKWLLILGSGVLVTLIPSTVASAQFQNSIPAELILSTLLDIGHLNPLPLARFMRDPQAIGFLSWFSLAIFTIAFLPRKNNETTILLSLNSLVAGLVLIFSQWVGIVLEIPTLILISGGRVSYILAMWVIPLIMALLLHYFRTHNAIAIAILTSAISITVYSRIPFFIFVHIILLLFVELIQRNILPFKIQQIPFLKDLLLVGVLVTFVITLAFFLGEFSVPLSTESEYSGFALSILEEVSDAVKPWHFAAIAITATLVFINARKDLIHSIPSRHSYSKWGISLLLITFIGGTFTSINSSKDRFQNETVYEMKQLQDWALKNTAKDAFFMGVITGWRSRTIRPYLYFIPRSWYIYTKDDRLLQWQVDHLEWLGHETEPPHPTYGVGGDTGFYKLNSQSVLGLRDEDGVDYAIWSNKAHNLDFKIVFETENYKIYNLHHPLSALLTDADLQIGSALKVDSLPKGGFIFDTRQDAGFNSLRPNIILDYVPVSRVTPSAISCYQDGFRMNILKKIIAQPDQMNFLKIEYIYIDSIGWNQLSDESRLALSNPSIYEELIAISHEGDIRALYRLRGFDLSFSASNTFINCN